MGACIQLFVILKKEQGQDMNFYINDESMIIMNQGKVMHSAAGDKHDEAVYLWFVLKRTQDMLVHGPSHTASCIAACDSRPPLQ